MTRAAALLAALLLWPLAVSAEIAAEVYDETGRRIGEQRLYPGAGHRALVVVTETGRTARDPAARERLAAWLEATGLRTQVIDASDGLEDRALSAALRGWVESAAAEPEAGLLLVIDSRLGRNPVGPGLVLSRTGPSAEPVALAPVMRALDDSAARHVLVAFTVRIEERDVAWGSPARAQDDGPGWLTSARLRRRARQAVVPWGGDLSVVDHLAAALSDAPSYAAAAPAHADPDAFVTAEDLVSAAGRGLELWRFGVRDEGGSFVLVRHDIPESRFDGRPSVAEAYHAAQAALRLGTPAALDAFLAEPGETRWHVAARRQSAALSARLLAAEGARCDAALTLRPAEILSLNAGVIGRLDAFTAARDLARSWLEALPAAAGLGPREIRGIEDACAKAETDADRAPARALRLALLDREPDRAYALLGAERSGATASAAVLAGLRLLAHGPGAAGPGPVLRALDTARREGDGAAHLVSALVLFDGTYRTRAPAEALELLAEAGRAGVSVAHALRAAVLVSEHRGPETWRAGRRPDRPGAFQALSAARQARIEIDPAFGLEGLEGEGLRACLARLVALDPADALDPAALPSLAALDSLLNRTSEALRPAVSRVAEATARAACARLPEPAGLDRQSAGLRDDALLRLAVLDLAAGKTEDARARLTDLTEPSPEARTLAALAADPSRRRLGFEAAAAAGSALAELAAALIALEAGTTAAETRGALDRLAAVSDDGVPVADAAMAAALLGRAGVAPAMSAEARTGADRALLEGLLRAASAEARGVAMSLDPADVAAVATRAPGLFGLGLTELTPAHRRLLGRGVPARTGALVAAAPPGRQDLAAGDVILTVQGQAVTSRAETEQAFLAALFPALSAGTAVPLQIWRPRTGATAEVALVLPPTLAEVRVPPILARP